MAIAPFNIQPQQAYSEFDFSPLANLGQQMQRQQQLSDLAKLYGATQQGSPPTAPAADSTTGSVGPTTASTAANYMHGQYGGPGQNLTTITLDSGRKITVNAAAAPSFTGFLNELEKSGYPLSDIGGYNNRNIRGSNRLSQHAYGNAIDVNPGANPMGGTLTTNLPPNVGDMARKYGLVWGGNWTTRKDPMHFEWMGPR